MLASASTFWPRRPKFWPRRPKFWPQGQNFWPWLWPRLECSASRSASNIWPRLTSLLEINKNSDLTECLRDRPIGHLSARSKRPKFEAQMANSTVRILGRGRAATAAADPTGKIPLATHSLCSVMVSTGTFILIFFGGNTTKVPRHAYLKYMLPWDIL